MRRTLISSLIAILVSGFCFAQVTYYDVIIDSLLDDKEPTEQYASLESYLQKTLGQDGPKSIRLAKKLIELGELIEDPLHVGQGHYHLGVSYEIIGQYDIALEECYTALDYFSYADNPLATARVYNEIGIIYLISNDQATYPKGLEAFKKYMSFLDPEKNKLDIARASTNICGVYLHMGQNDSALIYVNKSVRLYNELDLAQNQVDNYINLGLIYYVPETRDSTAYYWHKAEEIVLQNKNLAQLGNIYQNLIDYYITDENLPKAKEYIDKKVILTDQLNSHYVRMKTLEAQSYYYEKVGNFSKAYSFHKQFQSLSDSLRSRDVDSRMANLEAVYNLNIKDQQIELLEKTDRIKQLKIKTLIGLSVAILLFAFVIIWFINRKRDQDKKMAQLQIEKQNLREEELQVQIEFKSKQMTSHALNMMMKNQFLAELEKSICEINEKLDSSHQHELRKVSKNIQRNTQADNDWELFRNYFEEVNSGFYEKLNKEFPGLSSNDYKLCALLKLNMNIKESASILNISPESVKTARYRLRRKLKLEPLSDLHEFIQSI